jgi:hypothetical protein
LDSNIVREDIKMITHIILLKLKNRSQESIEKAKDTLLSMKGKIEYLRDLTVAVDFLHADISYDIALIAKFDSREDLKAYVVHPVHVKIGKYVEEVQESIAAIDYEV